MICAFVTKIDSGLKSAEGSFKKAGKEGATADWNDEGLGNKKGEKGRKKKKQAERRKHCHAERVAQ